MLDPDRNESDFTRFYDRIGAAQLEERYLAANAYAIARMHLVLHWLLPIARTGGKLLDIGCASGYYSVAFAKAGGEATGIDISEASVALARRRAERAGVADRCTFVCGDMRSPGLAQAEFDAALMVEVLEHVREQRQAVGEAIAVLRRGGRLVLTTPHALDELSRRQRWRHRGAPTPEDAGVRVDRLDTNRFVEDEGIAHQPYFHDAFTFSQLADLLPPEAEIVRLHSLWMDVPAVGTLARLFPASARERTKRMLGWQTTSECPDPASEQGKDAETDGPLEIPQLGLGGRLMVKVSKTMWQVPILRSTSYHCLLVARRTGTSRHDLIT